MKVIIEISKDAFENVRNGKVMNGSIASKMILNAVMNGTPVPEHDSPDDIHSDYIPTPFDEPQMLYTQKDFEEFTKTDRCIMCGTQRCPRDFAASAYCRAFHEYMRNRPST